MDIETSWEAIRKQKNLVGRPINVWHMDSQITGTVAEIREGKPGIIEIVLGNPQRRKRFSSDNFVPALFDVLLIDTNTSKAFKIDNGSKLYITLPRADHTIIG